MRVGTLTVFGVNGACEGAASTPACFVGAASTPVISNAGALTSFGANGALVVGALVVVAPVVVVDSPSPVIASPGTSTLFGNPGGGVCAVVSRITSAAAANRTSLIVQQHIKDLDCRDDHPPARRRRFLL